MMSAFFSTRPRRRPPGRPRAIRRCSKLAGMMILLVLATMTTLPGAAVLGASTESSAGAVLGSTGDSPASPRPPISAGKIDGYLILPPAIFRSGSVVNIPVSLFSGERPARGRVELTLTQAGTEFAAAAELIQGSGLVPLALPEMPAGKYHLGLTYDSFFTSREVQVEHDLVLFVESDKPIYKPGQRIRIRALRLNSQLKPRPGVITTEVQDADGNKVFRDQSPTDEFGMLDLSLPISEEPVLGTWEARVSFAGQTARTEIRVERYHEPAFHVEVKTLKDWVLPDEQIIGIVRASYPFGKPVTGEAEIVASRFYGAWREISRTTLDLNGAAVYLLPAPGVVQYRGDKQVRLDVTVKEPETGQFEQATHVVTIESSPEVVRLIPESATFKPALPLSVLVLTETPGGRPLNRHVGITVSYLGPDLSIIHADERRIQTATGKALVQFDPPPGSVALNINARSGDAEETASLRAGHSPSGNYVHLRQLGSGILNSDDEARFRAFSTNPAKSYFYEVVARGQVMLADVSASPQISFTVTPAMSPGPYLIVYQLLADGEIVADYLPFEVGAGYPLDAAINLGEAAARPGDEVEFELVTDGPARVGLAVVDSSLFALSENRINVTQVLNLLDNWSVRPQLETYERRPYSLTTIGPRDAFEGLGLNPISNKSITFGKRHSRSPDPELRSEIALELVSGDGGAGTTSPGQPPPPPELAPVPRLRQYFPETWLWSYLRTDEDGRATISSVAPDRITNWDLRIVAISKEHGLGISRAALTVAQPFFARIDLPYSVIRGDEFPISIALHNYLDVPQTIEVELAQFTGIEFRDGRSKSVTVAADAVGSADFSVVVSELGQLPIQVSARSPQAADALVRQLLVEPEGVRQEWLENAVLQPGSTLEFDNHPPPGAVPGSTRTRVALTANHLGQALDSLLHVDRLLELPAGCGEQALALLAVDANVATYLAATGPPAPEVASQIAEYLQVGFQRQLTFRHDDGSFSVWGRDDPGGELWITAFALKTLAEAKKHIYVDQRVIDEAADWMVARQHSDGSFGVPGFVHHQQLLAGTDGHPALTAYVATALKAAGRSVEFQNAVGYLEGLLDQVSNPYATAIVAYVLELADSPQATPFNSRLLGLARSDANGLSWGSGRTIAIETTAYAALALFERGDLINGSKAARWLTSQRNRRGGFGSTQDTVLALKALSRYAALVPTGADITINLAAGDWERQIKVDASNGDLLQIVDVPTGDPLTITGSGSGEVLAQVARRFNRLIPEPGTATAFSVEMAYSGSEFAVGEMMTILAEVKYAPAAERNSGMVLVEIQIPTGFALTREGSDSIGLQISNPPSRRVEVSGRTVILYFDDFESGQIIEVAFDVRAFHAAVAQPAQARAWAYYLPELNGRGSGPEVVVTEE